MNMNENQFYELWVLGYDVVGNATDTEWLIGDFDTYEKAKEKADQISDVECITGKPDHPDFTPLPAYNPEAGDYVELQLQKVVEHNADYDDDSWTECIDVMSAKRLPAVSEG